ncbi:MAG: molybdopterin-dependent oxidoreductase [Deltaproteobacteria bacterium]|nr:molybdopterin-dependent oxidoreductase [Deltaproteobacteria bacterium]
MGSDRVVRNVCPRNCPDTCGVLTYVKGGRVVKIEGDPNHPVTRGNLCHKGYQDLSMLYSPDRITYPMRRVGAKGEGRFERITWDVALDVIAKQYQKSIAQFGSESILPYWYSGNLGLITFLIPFRFFNRVGASNLQQAICTAAGEAATSFTQGPLGMDPEDFVNSKLIVVWGSNTTQSNPHFVPIITRAIEKNGAKLIVVDPRRNEIASMAGIHLQPNVGTDAALALGLINVIVRKGLHDVEFIEKHIVGFEQLRESAARYPLDKVARITGIPAADIDRVATLYATVKPAAIRLGYGMQRHTNGGMMVRAICALPALCGHWGKSGGGLGYINIATWFNYNIMNLIHPELRQGQQRTINMTQLGETLVSADPPVKLLHVFNSNPGAMLPQQNKLREGLRREDLFTVVSDLFMTDTAKYADIFLPAVTYFEKMDLNQCYSFLYCQLNQQAVEPLGEAKPDDWVFNQLAQRLGFTEPCFNETQEEMIRGALETDHPFLQGITYERLLNEGAVHLQTPSVPFVPYQDGQFATDSGKVELYSEKMASQGLAPGIDHVPLAESREETPELFRKYPIYLLTGSTALMCNSSYGDQSLVRTVAPVPTIEIHPDDASPRAISDGDWVYVENDRGRTKLLARISESVKPGMAFTPKDYWTKFCPDGTNANFTTPDRLADLGGCSTFQTNLVEIRRV